MTLTTTIQPLSTDCSSEQVEQLRIFAAHAFETTWSWLSGEAPMTDYLAKHFEPKAYEALVRDTNNQFWTLTNGNELLAYSQVIWTPDELPDCVKLLTPNAVYLERLYVDPKRKGQGLGSQLLTHVLEACQAYPAEAVYLGVYYDNPAKRLYKRHGFEKVGKRVFMVGSTECQDDYLLKWL